MQKVDGFYLYQVGADIRQIKNLKGEYNEGDGNANTYEDAFLPLFFAEKALTPFLEKSDFRLRMSQLKGNELKTKIQKLSKKLKMKVTKQNYYNLLISILYTML